jgi:hypothetical protein
MKICRTCSALSPREAKFCTKCGSLLPRSTLELEYGIRDDDPVWTEAKPETPAVDFSGVTTLLGIALWLLFWAAILYAALKFVRWAWEN